MIYGNGQIGSGVESFLSREVKRRGEKRREKRPVIG